MNINLKVMPLGNEYRIVMKTPGDLMPTVFDCDNLPLKTVEQMCKIMQHISNTIYSLGWEDGLSAEPNK